MSALKAIHAKRRQVHSLKEDDDWRAFVEKHTGQRSTRGLSPSQTKALLAALDDMGAPKIKPKAKLSGPYATKLQALWISCWNLGLVRNPRDEALMAFATHQAKVDHANWIRDHRDAMAVIEALKSMMERAGVDWFTYPDAASYEAQPGYKIAKAQWAKISKTAPYAGSTFHGYLFHLVRKNMNELSREDWIYIMNSFGESLRQLPTEARK
ncbi:MAG: hypothetical protein CSA70_03565 [Rhodobacterales bacterium]|nr:MAG: hypothetical protein CSA70_03565 [Rhodobacterales bacterium]